MTHYDAGAFDELQNALSTGRFDTVQVPLNPRERRCERRILPLAQELGVAVIVMRPLAAGELLRRPPRDAQLAPLRPFGVETWPQALAQVGAFRPARRRRHPRHVETRARGGERPGRRAAVARPGRASPRGAPGGSLSRSPRNAKSLG